MNDKILIIRLSSMGDIVLTSPVVRVLKEQIGAEVHFLTKAAFASLLDSNPHLDRLWLLQPGESIRSVSNRLQEEEFDYIVDLHHNIRSIGISKLLKVKTFRFNKLNFEKWLFVNFKLNRLPDVHIVDRYLDTVEPLGVVNDKAGLEFFIGSENQYTIENPEFQNYVVFAVGAAHKTKQVPVSQAAPLLNYISSPIVLIGGPDDRDRAERIQDATCGPVLNLVGKLNIQQSASVIKQARLVMAPDTGMMHIAAALKKPIVLFWGSTSEEFGMYPYFGKHSIPVKNVKVDGLKCRPCTKFGKAKCPRGHFKCMLQWNPMRVAEEVEDFYQNLMKSPV
jgi:heptosyltransferase-2